MELQTLESYEEMSRKATDLILSSIGEKSNLLLCAATGSSPTGTYQMLADEFQRRPGLFSELRVIKLDEWGGVPLTQAGTCEAYLQEHLIRPLQIPGSRYISFDSNPENPEEACQWVSHKLKDEGPIDLCILGLGSNGHLAFNEPAEYLQADCHVARLTATSLQHSMTSEMPVRPSFGLTLGMADIMASKAILLLVSGKEKEHIAKQFLSRKISTRLPASFLWLHPNVICLVDKDAVRL